MLLAGVCTWLCAGLSSGAQAQSSNASGTATVTVQKFLAASTSLSFGVGPVQFSPPSGAVTGSKPGGSGIFTIDSIVFTQVINVLGNATGSITAATNNANPTLVRYTAANWGDLTATMSIASQVGLVYAAPSGSSAFTLRFSIPTTTGVTAPSGNPTPPTYNPANTVTLTISVS
jgi:hypothetical protein